jgi:hypothetical protein
MRWEDTSFIKDIKVKDKKLIFKRKISEMNSKKLICLEKREEVEIC